MSTPQLPPLPEIPQAPLHVQLNNITANLASDESVEKFAVKVNKTTGIATVSATNIHGQSVTKQLIGPGLAITTTHTPTDRAARTENIHALRSMGLTQTDIATRLGVSQATVQKTLANKP